MSWLRRVLEGSYKGVPFQLDGHEALDAGRRLALHEYPGGASPFAEDMGPVTREHEVKAFVNGDDYDLQRDLLVTACNAPGAGTLIHPYLNVRRVKCRECRVRESTAEGRIARLTMIFVEDGESRLPVSLADTPAALLGAVALAASAVATEFGERFSL